MLSVFVGAFFAPPPGIAMAQEAQTLKERLSDKASDAQRVDNCRVAAERRGTQARPDCPATPPAATPAAEPQAASSPGALGH
jgi:hypothetical protein